MSDSTYAKIVEWNHHPKVLVTISHIVALWFVLPVENVLGGVIATMLLALPVVVLLFFPYLAFVIISALCLSLLQSIAAGFRRSNPVVHSFPSR